LYLIARDANDNDKAVGFCHFRFEYDQQKKDNVLYVYVLKGSSHLVLFIVLFAVDPNPIWIRSEFSYELQVEESVRGKGLGQWMMKITELLALKYEMPWLLLTVFTENHKALHFYKEKLNYLVDELSPKPFEDEGYEILSKCFKR
jgi:GNAT superfamily N-acetyltransferase